MNGHSGDNSDDAKPSPDASRMALEGKDALDLYLAKIGRNASELQAQAVLLQEVLRERMELLRELQSSQSDDDNQSR